jgi:DNA-binding transcriptional LysR family regulator
MELRHLRYFAAVAEELHFARAATRLNIAPATLSEQIRSLETLVGASLLVRKARSVTLTKAGEMFLVEARATLAQADRAAAIGRLAGRGELGTINLGFVLSSACSGLVGSAVAAFRQSRPNVMVNLRKAETYAQYEALVAGNLDVGFARAPKRYPPQLTGFVVDRQNLLVAIPAGHHLASRQTIDPEALFGEPLVTTYLEMELGFWGHVSAVIPLTQAQIVIRVPDLFSLLTVVSSGSAIAVVSSCVNCIQLPGVIYRPIKASRTSDHVLVHRRGETSSLVQAFVHMVRRCEHQTASWRSSMANMADQSASVAQRS